MSILSQLARVKIKLLIIKYFTYATNITSYTKRTKATWLISEIEEPSGLIVNLENVLPNTGGISSNR